MESTDEIITALKQDSLKSLTRYHSNLCPCPLGWVRKNQIGKNQILAQWHPQSLLKLSSAWFEGSFHTLKSTLTWYEMFELFYLCNKAENLLGKEGTFELGNFSHSQTHWIIRHTKKSVEDNFLQFHIFQTHPNVLWMLNGIWCNGWSIFNLISCLLVIT